MSLMACRSCSTRFAVGLLRCPQCQAVSEIYARPGHEADAEEESMPKITVGGGASNVLADTEIEIEPQSAEDTGEPLGDSGIPNADNSVGEDVTTEVTPNSDNASRATPRRRSTKKADSTEE